MSGFPIGFVVSIAVATIVLCIVGWVIWHKMFGTSTKYSDQIREPQKSKIPQTSVDPEMELSGVDSQQLKTVSAAETISNQSDEAVVELKKQLLSNQKTVENAGDVSISMDEEE